jgi:hypothetical protein
MIYTNSMNLGSMWNNNSKKFRNNTTNKKQIFSSIKISKPILKNTNQKINKTIRPDSRSYWGNPTWTLFHTIAEKINNSYYINNYMIVWNFIKDICNNLPCPFCKNHAVKYIKLVNINDIKTKEGLKKALFEFHNYVNRNSNKKVEDISILNKYKHVNVLVAFQYFEKRFFRSYIGTRQFKDWINNALKERYKEFCKTINHFI